jgi:ribosomal 30S subunit maturation factor RimM
MQHEILDRSGNVVAVVRVGRNDVLDVDLVSEGQPRDTVRLVPGGGEVQPGLPL